MNYLGKILPALLGILILIAVVQLGNVSIEEILARIKNTEIKHLSVIMFLSFILIKFKAMRWAQLTHLVISKETYPRGFFFFYYVASLLATYNIHVLAGDLGVKALALKKKSGATFVRSSTTVILEHALNLLIMLLVAPPAFLFVFGIISGFAALSMTLADIIFVCIIIFFYYEKSIACIEQMLSTVGDRLERYQKIRYIIEEIDFETMKKKKGEYIRLCIISSFIYILFVINYYYFSIAINIDIPFLAFMLSFPVVYLVSAIGITPGSIGITEAGWLGVLLLIGINKEAAIYYVIYQRIFTFFPPFIFVLIAYFIFAASNKKIAQQTTFREK